MKKRCVKNNFKKIVIFVLVIGLSAVYITMWRQNVYASIKELHATLVQKTNPYYNEIKERGDNIVYKVKIKKKTIVIYGSLGNYDTGKETKIGKHTYKLSKNVKYISYGGDVLETEYTKQNFKKLLDKRKDSGLCLTLEIKNGRVIKITYSS